MISGYVDIHAHVLPGIDDGPANLEESLAMARAAVASGIARLAATPHLRPDFPDVNVVEIADRCRELSEILGREGIRLDLVPGAEVSLLWALEASDEALLMASYGGRGEDLLIEAPFSAVLGLEQFLYQLQARGYRITLAHPERNPEFQSNGEVARKLVDQGVLLQLNAGSLLSSVAGRRTRATAMELLKAGLAQVFASDGHRGSSWRPVGRLAEAVEAAAGVVGADRAQWMAKTAPDAILAGTELPDPPPMDSARRRRWLFGLG